MKADNVSSMNFGGGTSETGSENLLDGESRKSSELPRVSIGMPVYNGEKYITRAIESILSQTFEDFELIICDNASTDSTREICDDYAKRDERIRYFRNNKNIGAGPNFNKAVEYARGTYFKWAAHDDLCAPDFLRLCVENLDKDPDAVLAHPVAQIIDEDSAPVMINEEDPKVGHLDPVVRFTELTRGHRCFQVFGLIRLSDLKATPMIGLFARGDALLLCWLALRGRFIKIDEVLFFPRSHETQSMSMLANKKLNKKVDYVAYSEWFDPRLAKRMVFPWWRGSWELFKCVSLTPITLGERFRCYWHVVKWIFARRRALASDVFRQFRRISS
ncbi:glycosyl transferase, group 2 family protein [Verrucomicrobiia bacterium DG1235]|nr:glycosyl transferase, group 2 family protein [Verrucomicrobiae bacterium DG1235]